jgi:murein DD-endopeptidase MepM/ murein hydrolase activator NlpD
MIIRKVFLFVLIICVFAFDANSQSLSTFTHEVKPGETLYSISLRYGITVDALKTSNGLSSNAVVAGQILRVVKPVVPQDDNTMSERPDCRLMYKVQKKETVYSICKKFDLTEEEFYAANPILLEKLLRCCSIYTSCAIISYVVCVNKHKEHYAIYKYFWQVKNNRKKC